MHIVIAGASGFLGRHLTTTLAEAGHRVTRLVRREASGDDEFAWNPDANQLDAKVLSGADAVINLCGAGVADKRWSAQYKQLILHSRVKPTTLLAQAVAEMNVPVLLNGSAVGWYDSGEQAVDETQSHGRGFLSETCAAWEQATEPAERAGTRVVKLRTGHVLSHDSVMLKRLLPLFKLGLGGKFGSGRQYLPWVSLTDWLDATVFTLDNEISGPVNLVGPTPATNVAFTMALAKALRRPALFTVPGLALNLVAGEAAVELLEGAKIVPKALKDNGYRFAHPTIDRAVSAALSG